VLHPCNHRPTAPTPPLPTWQCPCWPVLEANRRSTLEEANKRKLLEANRRSTLEEANKRKLLEANRR